MRVTLSCRDKQEDNDHDTDGIQSKVCGVHTEENHERVNILGFLGSRINNL